MAYLPNAPPALIRLYEQRSKFTEKLDDIDVSKFVINATRPLLLKLLSNTRMKRAWNIIAKSVKTSEDYNKLFKAIIEAMRLARQGITSPVARKDRYENISKLAVTLANLIEIPDTPPNDRSGYRGELDLQAYDILPKETASILEALRPRATNNEASNLAYSVFCQQMRMVDLLNELAAKATEKANDDVPSRRRSRSELAEETKEQIATKTKARLFTCYLDAELRRIHILLKGTAAVRAIASVAYGVDLDSEMLKKAVLDHRKKEGVKMA
jgi:hypothetical protein